MRARYGSGFTSDPGRRRDQRNYTERGQPHENCDSSSAIVDDIDGIEKQAPPVVRFDEVRGKLLAFLLGDALAKNCSFRLIW
jgi:hypothetical protein